MKIVTWIFVLFGLGCSLAAAAEEQQAPARPNILWLTSEDNNVTYLGCYGNKYAKTPNIDQLAEEGFLYSHCYSNGAVCSASRSTWITGMLSPSTGLHHHRSIKQIPNAVTLYPKVLREAGYYTVNSNKMDYNIANYDRGTWDSSKLDWQLLQQKQPFFQVINLVESHESRAMSTACSSHDPAKVILPPYLPDIEGVRANYAYYYESMTRMDAKVGRMLQELEAAGLAENTIVIHNSDHGGPLPRGKRTMYNSGTHCPLIIRIPEKYKTLWPAEKPGMKVDRMVSFVDMIPTWISLAGGPVPDNYHGRVFLGPETQPEAAFHYSFRGRNDARIENARALRNKQFVYVKNYLPYVPRGQYLSYQWKIPAQRIWEAEYKAGRTNADQRRFFQTKPDDELYDSAKDPYCLNNLADSPEFKEVVRSFSASLKEEQRRLYDAAFLPESELDRIAEAKGLTLYEVLREKECYDLAAYQPVADRALMGNVAHVPALTAYLKHRDVGIRYWGATGLMMLAEESTAAQAPLEARLDDPSHNVRLMAAWALIKMGVSDAAYPCIEDMIKTDSYAMLEIVNVIDWMGEAGKPLLPSVKNIKSKNKLVREMQNYLLNGPVGSKKKTKRVTP